mmetsp:Transcript_71000/g.205830  ORF Transcript_71000/g.205830 Transcript_71000/m.205830 type:complete len:174 (+) Transcript_71000:128-649(+)
MASATASALWLALLLMAASAVQNIDRPVSEPTPLHALMRQEDLEAELPAERFAEQGRGMHDTLLEVSESSIEQGSVGGHDAGDVTAGNGVGKPKMRDEALHELNKELEKSVEKAMTKSKKNMIEKWKRAVAARQRARYGKIQSWSPFFGGCVGCGGDLEPSHDADSSTRESDS